jgi:sodium-dependent dicarboxylate transporter 2/3/5
VFVEIYGQFISILYIVSFFIQGLMMAIAIEDCNLHNRVSLFVLKIVGTSPRKLVLGFMLSTAFLSMWISDTATCAMMIPILQAVLDEVLSTTIDPESLQPILPPNNLRAMLCFSVSLASNIGGTTTTIGKYCRAK